MKKCDRCGGDATTSLVSRFNTRDDPWDPVSVPKRTSKRRPWELIGGFSAEPRGSSAGSKVGERAAADSFRRFEGSMERRRRAAAALLAAAPNAALSTQQAHQAHTHANRR